MSAHDGLLVTSKLSAPAPRAGLVSRPRLYERLGAIDSYKLVLIAAPAGSGKTTLLGDWAARLRQAPAAGVVPAVAWLSLDERDDDPARFLACLFGALQAAGVTSDCQAPAALGLGPAPAGEAALTPLLNHLAAVERQVYLVLDDYHVIHAPAIHQGIDFFLTHQPANVHVVLATRTDPPLSLGQLRARLQLLELQAADLRFTIEEAAVFLNDVMGLTLAAADVAALEERTEGWIAGLQLAALSLAGQDPARAAGFIETFSGTHRHVVDYLLEQVLDRQPREVLEFLLCTSILDRLSAPLCDALMVDWETGKLVNGAKAAPANDSTSVPIYQSTDLLAYLDTSHLFLVPLDYERRWYRYHRLFRDLLHARLEQVRPAALPVLHGRAAAWHAGHGDAVEAVDHALAARDFEMAAGLIEQSVEAVLWQRGEVSTVLRWLAALPERVILARPGLCLIHAWASFLTVDLYTVEARAAGARHALRDDTLPAAVRRELLDQLVVVEAMLANFRGDLWRTVELSCEALAVVPEGNTLLRGALAGNLGGAYMAIGDAAAAVEAFAEATRVYRASGNSFVTLIAESYEAAAHVAAGRLHEAAGMYRRILSRLTTPDVAHSLGAGLAHAGLGNILYEWGELDEAGHHLETALEIGRRQGNQLGPGQQIAIDSTLGLARVHNAIGATQRAIELVQEAKRWAQESAPEQLTRVAAARARIDLSAKDVVGAARWARSSRLGAGDEPVPALQFEYLTLARVLIAQGEPSAALELVERWQRSAQAGQRAGALLESQLLRAVALWRQKKLDRAAAAFREALHLASPQGYIRTLADEGAAVAELLAAAGPWPAGDAYVDKLASALQASLQAERPPAAPPPACLSEPLTERELEVLGHIAAGLSNDEIAARLVLSVATVKKHAGNIYGKLGVNSRTQAVAVAREIGVL